MPADNTTATAEPTGADAPLAEQLATADAANTKSDASDDTPSTKPEPKPEPEREILDLVKERFGTDYSDKYEDDAAFLTGATNALSLASRRDVDAERGRQIVDMLGGREAELKAFLSGETTQPAAAADPAVPFDPALARTQMELNGEGTLVPRPGAPAGVVQRYEQHQEEIRRSIEKIHADPRAYFSEAMAEEITKQVEEQTGQQSAKHRDAIALEKWGEENAKRLHVGGDTAAGMTPLGRKVANLYHSDPELQDVTEGLPRLKMALRLARDDQPQTRTSPASPQSKRQPETAPALPDDTPGLRDGEELAEALERLLGTAGATVG